MPTEQTPLRRRASSVVDFCQRHSISRALFYKLQSQGKAPRVTKIGRRSLITDTAEEEWHRSLGRRRREASDAR
jgi:predicted DNA-binding transcriptional regulator AlpA